jgi:hypothetical protein
MFVFVEISTLCSSETLCSRQTFRSSDSNVNILDLGTNLYFLDDEVWASQHKTINSNGLVGLLPKIHENEATGVTGLQIEGIFYAFKTPKRIGDDVGDFKFGG